MRWLALFLAMVTTSSALAEEAKDVAASAPLDRSVTIYRAPYRNGGRLTLNSLGGFAVITEIRRVDLPAGDARLRFVGVADGIIPESAIISGLPGGVIEKNEDRALLSPSALMRAAVGREVILRRTDRKTGRVSAVPAKIVSASSEGVVMSTGAGTEALRCSGVPEAFRFLGGLGSLSPEPTLSVRTRSADPIHTRVRLTYIAENFDWNANYIAHIGADGKTLDLSGWITLANGNGVSLANANTRIVAGGLNRAYIRRFMSDQPQVLAKCWPMQRTNDILEKVGKPYELVRPWQPLPLPPSVMAQPRLFRMASASPVMASVAAAPKAEQLGDLKLYRVAERTTIAARQMKQTSLIAQTGIPFETYYRAEAQLMPWPPSSGPQAATLMLRSINDKAHHLGLPLPAGSMLVEQEQGGRVMLVGEPNLRDAADGEKLDLALGSAPDITCAWARSQSSGGHDYDQLIVTLTNASPQAAAIELRLATYGNWIMEKTSAEAPKIDGVPTVKLLLASGEQRQIAISMAQK